MHSSLNIKIFILISILIHAFVIFSPVKKSEKKSPTLKSFKYHLISGKIVNDKKPLLSNSNEKRTSTAEIASKKLNDSPLSNSSSILETPLEEENLSVSKHYRSTDELHTRAVPIVDWKIDTSQVPNDIFFVLIFTVWVSETGTIDFIEYPTSADEPPWVNAARANLAQTEMQPATLDGRPVPSTMTVEISVEPEH